jgi:Zn-dependent peptidase ImmA (M78 family)
LRNAYLSDRTAADINARVAKVLRGLGNPEPPLELELVRDLLKLDRKFYSSNDDSAAREFVHKLKMAGKQLVLRPTLIWDVVKKFDLKALYLPDRKRILMDSTLPLIKQRWGEAHEIGHSIIDWHELFMHGDDKLTLSPSCHAQLEGEANFAAGRLLFLGDRLVRELNEQAPSIRVVQSLGKTFGNSMTATLWRVVEHLGVPAIGLVTDHPTRPAAASNAAESCRYFIRSRTFERQFGKLTEIELFAVVRGYCGFRMRGPLGEGEVSLRDDNGVDHIFFLETFFNGHEALTLGMYRSPRPTLVTLDSAAFD